MKLKVSKLLSELEKSLKKENFTKFDDIVNKIHAIADNEGLTEAEYSKWDTLRGKANKIQIQQWKEKLLTKTK